MKIRILPIVALAALVGAAACKKEGEAGSETTTSDTMAVPGTDTVSQPVIVPATDSVVTTTTTETDTIQGQAGDSVMTDTTTRP